MTGSETATDLLYMIVAYLLAVPLGWTTERHERSAGIRTFPLVSLAACAFLLTGLREFENELSGARIMYGLITGIGFIGGGAILKSEKGVSGTAVAASIWTTGAIGVAVAFGRFDIAVLLSIAAPLTIRLGPLFKGRATGVDD